MNEKIEEIKKELIDNKIKHIYLTFVDFSGELRTKTVGVQELINNTHVSWLDGISINGSLINDFKNDKSSDWLVIIPDPYSFRILSFINDDTQKSAIMMCSIKNFKLDTRSKLTEAFQEFRDNNLTPVFGTQLIYKIEDNKQELYSSQIMSESIIFNNNVVNCLLDSNIDVEYYLPYGKYHNRIDLVPDIAVNAADKYTFAKLFAKSLSIINNYPIEFKGFDDQNLSSCPIHASLWDENKKNNLFYDEKDEFELSDLSRKFINGVLYFEDFIYSVIVATTNSPVKTFKRQFSTERDDSLIQVPLYFKEKQKKDRIGWSKRCIYQAINSDCNIYLVLACFLYAGLYGIKNDMKNFENSNNKILKKEELINYVDNNDYYRKKLGDEIISMIVKYLEEKYE